MADDVPSALAGYSVGQIRVFVAEWLASWIEPQALVVRIYDGGCPPALMPDATYTIPWSELETELLYEVSPRTVYQVDAALDPPFTVNADMSIGVYCVIDWENQPYTGVCVTAPDDLSGCGEGYWDYPASGYPRWTLLWTAAGYELDLAYSLWEPDTSAPGGDSALVESTWSVVKSLYR